MSWSCTKEILLKKKDTFFSKSIKYVVQNEGCMKVKKMSIVQQEFSCIKRKINVA